MMGRIVKYGKHKDLLALVGVYPVIVSDEWNEFTSRSPLAPVYAN